MSHYIEEVHALKLCSELILILYIMHLISVQLQRQSPLVFGRFSSVKDSSSIHISNGGPHNDIYINASNVSSFSQLLRSFFTHFCLENPRSHIVVLAERSCSQF